ncbi:hypothetical protein ACFW1M_20440 [Streptomyces inhibens]|uniref:hypothetical protein n=1 Tax=Streptomyces inhibens TaxID=2293571 RepID=UPI0036A83FED
MYWTLFVELKFYLITAVVMLFGVTYRNCLILCGVWTVAAALAPVLNTPLVTEFAMPQYAPSFLAGIAFYLMRRHRPNAILWAIVILQLLFAQSYIDNRLATNLGKAAVDALQIPAPVLVASVTAHMLVTAWLVHGLIEHPLGKWLRTTTHRGIGDVRQHVTPRLRHARRPSPQTPTVSRTAEDDRTTAHARTFESV